MEQIKKILAPTDFSELSCIGVRRALEIARKENAAVIVYHVIGVRDDWFAGPRDFSPTRDLLEGEKQLLDKFLRTRFSEYMNLMEIRQMVEIGVPYVNIVELAEKEGVDLIVMSTHGNTGFSHMLLGSVTGKVVPRAPCPVLSIPAIERKKISAQEAA